MNTQPVHDAETGDLRGSQQLVAKPDDIAIADMPNADTDDMRGHEPAPETDVESDHTKMIVGAVVAAVVLAAVVSYATGMWNAAPVAPATRVAAIAVPAPLPVVAPPPVAVAPAVPATEVEGAPPPVVKRAAVSSHRSAVRAPSKATVAPPATPAPPTAAPPEPTPIMTAPPDIEPTPPAQILPDQPTTP